MDVLPAVPRHLVNFYDGEHDLVEAIGPFLCDGLRGGEMAVVIATQQHRRLFNEYLRDQSIPVDLLEDQGIYVALDAASVLRSFMIDGSPDREKFRNAVVPFALAAAAKHRPLRAFGEMVGVLWKGGNVRGAVHLEKLWNEVIDAYGLTLYCAYSARMFSDTLDLHAAAEICHNHSTVVSPGYYRKHFPSDSPSDTVTHSFLPTPDALAAARWFVQATLRAWGHDAFSVGAVSVATAQLVTAVLHDNLQPFRVTLRREAHGVRVEVEHPAEAFDAESGNASQVALVHRLAKDWGAKTNLDTTTVWATFAA